MGIAVEMHGTGQLPLRSNKSWTLYGHHLFPNNIVPFYSDYLTLRCGSEYNGKYILLNIWRI